VLALDLGKMGFAFWIPQIVFGTNLDA
jgi:hypothetical protein